MHFKTGTTKTSAYARIPGIQVKHRRSSNTTIVKVLESEWTYGIIMNSGDDKVSTGKAGGGLRVGEAPSP